jgi:hypothetical protein
VSEVIVFAIAASYSIYITVFRHKYKLDKSVYICDALECAIIVMTACP